MANWLDNVGGVSGLSGNFGKTNPAVSAQQERERASYLKKTFGITPIATTEAAREAANARARSALPTVKSTARPTPSPADMPQTAPIRPATSGATGGTAARPASSSLADMLNIDVSGAYTPALTYLQQQEQLARQRYETNQANLKNIFGALSGLAAADQARINEQFTQSIAASQKSLADRMAAENAATAAGVAQAEATGAERGMGPGMAVNPIQAAQAEGQSQANAAQTVWEGLQGANQSQALADTRLRQQGFDYQQVAAMQDLQNSLENRLMDLSGQSAGVQSDLAKARLGVEQNVAQAKYSEALAARQAAAAAAAAANAPAKPTSYSKDVYGFQSRVNDAFRDASAFDAVLGGVSAAANLVAQRKRAAVQPGKTPTATTKAELISAWNSMPNKDTRATPFVIEYINKYSGAK